MQRQRPDPDRASKRRHAGLVSAPAALLLAAALSAQTTQNTKPVAPPPKRPVTSTAAQHPQQAQQAQASRWHMPFFGNRSQTGTNAATPGASSGAQSRSFFGNLFHRNSTPASAPNSGSNPLRTQGSPATGPSAHRGLTGDGRSLAGQARAPGDARGLTGGGNGAGMTRLASAGTGPLPTGRPVQSQAFLGHPGPPGSRELQAANGNLVRTAADGSVIDTHVPSTGMSIHHATDGSRRVTVDQPDGSRVVIPARGAAYVQHPYLFQAHPYDHRTFYDHGQVSHQFYRPYTYGATTLDAYAPQRFYSPEVYQWATTRYSAPQVPAWNYVTTSAPWFTYNRGYFTPEPSYASPVEWLTDFVLASSLIAAYNAHPPGTAAPAAAPQAAPAQPVAPQPRAASAQYAAQGAAAAPAGALPPAATEPAAAARAAGAAPTTEAAPEITPQVKEMLADEVSRQIKEESSEARQDAQGKEPQPGAGGIVQELNVKEPHVFVVSSDLDLVDETGRRCMLHEADVVQVISGAKATTSTAQAVVIASRGDGVCERSAQVDISLTDLQEMQNHMRETIDQGLANTRTGRGASTATPAFAAAAPPPDPHAGQEIQQQQQIAALTDG